MENYTVREVMNWVLQINLADVGNGVLWVFSICLLLGGILTMISMIRGEKHD